ncbi:MAG TPA: hypothetical protein VMT00_05445 [Thermoanaerobaculia bacterium]|nr:hypothetical protein [Thermoanaerobaculia bacterium]
MADDLSGPKERAWFGRSIYNARVGKVTDQQVLTLRDQMRAGRELASERFRAAFERMTGLPPEQRWYAHLEIQAASLLESIPDVSLPEGYSVKYVIGSERTIAPIVMAADEKAPASLTDVLPPERSFYPWFRFESTAAGLFAYWLVVSELLSSHAWQMTTVITNAGEYDEAIRRIEQPQLVRALVASFLPEADFSDDGTAMLSVMLYTRAGEERIERRMLRLDENQELHLHGRDLLVEGRGGV